MEGWNPIKGAMVKRKSSQQIPKWPTDPHIGISREPKSNYYKHVQIFKKIMHEHMGEYLQRNGNFKNGHSRTGKYHI